ncbi:MAG: DsrE family protein [Magnetococcales bacterium]|nr:DsrE family protein [Magnetococcales bacterium]
MKFIPLALALALLAATPVLAGPQDPSRFDPIRYSGQKAVYHFNFATPEQGMHALKYLRNHVKVLSEFGDGKPQHIAVVTQGNELHAFARENAAAFPEVYNELKELKEQGVDFRLCRNAARTRGYKPESFYDVFTVVPAAVAEITRLQNEGYGYIHPELSPPVTRDEMAKQRPELSM